MKYCNCGCGDKPRSGDFMPGHDQKLRTSLENDVGGLLNLKDLIGIAKKFTEGEINHRELGRSIRKYFSVRDKSLLNNTINKPREKNYRCATLMAELAFAKQKDPCQPTTKSKSDTNKKNHQIGFSLPLAFLQQIGICQYDENSNYWFEMCGAVFNWADELPAGYNSSRKHYQAVKKLFLIRKYICGGKINTNKDLSFNFSDNDDSTMDFISEDFLECLRSMRSWNYLCRNYSGWSGFHRVHQKVPELFDQELTEKEISLF